MQFKFSVLFSVATYLVASVAGAAVPNLEERDSKFLLISFEKIQGSANSLVVTKRGIYPNDLLNERIYYITYLDIGSNKQSIGVDIDTGSSDLWVPDVNAGGPHGSWDYGSYNPGQSSTARNTGEPFQIGYVDGTQIEGTYYEDTVSLGNSVQATIKNFQFADATTTTLDYGIFGIGRDLDETTQPSVYPNFLDRLKSDGLIATKGYSIFLNEAGASQGTVIFGGKDLDKIDGPLVAQPIVNDQTLAITLGSVTVNGQTFQSGDDSVLDTGTTTAAFTRELGDNIFSNYDNARFNGDLGVWLVDSDANIDQPVTFNFNGISITTSLASAYTNDVIDKYGNSYGPGFNIIEYNFNLLGDIFLSQAYVVYNYDANTVSIAKAKFTSSSNQVPL